MKRIERVVSPAVPVVRHSVDGDLIASALRRAGVPSVYARQESTLAAFPWGERMRAWLDGLPSLPVPAGRFISGPPEEAVPACAMLVRTLVMRAVDARFVTLSELLTDSEAPREGGWLVIAGFYDGQQHGKFGLPADSVSMTRLGWTLWRLCANGTGVIAYAAPDTSGVGNWWPANLLHSCFTTNDNLYLVKRI